LRAEGVPCPCVAGLEDVPPRPVEPPRCSFPSWTSPVRIRSPAPFPSCQDTSGRDSSCLSCVPLVACDSVSPSATHPLVPACVSGCLPESTGPARIGGNGGRNSELRVPAALPLRHHHWSTAPLIFSRPISGPPPRQPRVPGGPGNRPASPPPGRPPRRLDRLQRHHVIGTIRLMGPGLGLAVLKRDIPSGCSAGAGLPAEALPGYIRQEMRHADLRLALGKAWRCGRWTTRSRRRTWTRSILTLGAVRDVGNRYKLLSLPVPRAD